MHTVYINLYSLVIGRKYSATDVGYYNRAYSLAQFPSINIVGIITRVIYPVQCEMQGDDEQLNRSFIQYLRISCYIIFPLMVGLSVLAKPLVLVLLTEKWLPMSDLLSILSIAYMWYPIMVINNQILNVKGRVDYFLKAEIIKKILAIGILVTTIPFGIKILCLGVLLYNLLDVIIIIYFAKKVVLTGYFQQIKSVLPLLMLSFGMGGCTYIFMHLFTNPWIQLFIGIFIGPISYFIFSCFFCIREFKLVLSIVRRNRS